MLSSWRNRNIRLFGAPTLWKQQGGKDLRSWFCQLNHPHKEICPNKALWRADQLSTLLGLARFSTVFTLTESESSRRLLLDVLVEGHGQSELCDQLKTQTSSPAVPNLKLKDRY